MFTFISFAGKLEYAFIVIKNYSSIDAVIFYLFTFGCIFIIRYLSSFKAKVFVVLFTLANIGLYTTFDDSELLANNMLNVYMVDIGQGDSFLIKFPDNETALIDAGDAVPGFDNGERVIMPLLDRFGIKKIDYGFVSHIDADHYGGFVSLIENKTIKKIYKPFSDNQSEKDLRFERFLKKKSIPFKYYSKKEIKIGNTVIFILNNPQYESESRFSSNNGSGILKIVYGNTSFLFTGDLDMTGEKYYEKEYRNFLDVDVLKVSHHGSKTGSSMEFISLTSPKMSLVSCGIQNKFGHPSDEVINRLRDSNSLIFRTDKNGGVLLQSDGNMISKVNWKNNY
jgi:competence protein ComEC